MGRAPRNNGKGAVGSEFDEAKAATRRVGGPSMAISAAPTPSRGNRRDGGSDRARGPASVLEDIMYRKGVDEAWTALEEMQQSNVATDKYTVSRMLMKTVGDGRTRFNPQRIYRGMTLVEKFIDLQPQDVDEVLFNALLDTCCRLKDLPRLEQAVAKMKALKVTPSPVTLGILVKTYGQNQDLPKVLKVWDEMAEQREKANAVTYGCMIDACVKCGNLPKAVEIFTGMRESGKHKNTILYTTLIKGYGIEKDLSSALALFHEMPHEGVPYNTITYNSMLDACVKCGDLATGESLLREMIAPGSAIEPDLITFSTLLKGYCHIGQLDKALQVAEAIKVRGLHCDELVYNTLMDGCVKANDASAGLGLFEEMVSLGLKPSTITHSILARLYQCAGYEEGSSDAVAQLYLHHGLERPTGGDRGGGVGRRASSKSWAQRSPESESRQSPGASLLGSPLMSPLMSPYGSPQGSPSSVRSYGKPDFGIDPPRNDAEASWGRFAAVPPFPGSQATGPGASRETFMVPPLPGTQYLPPSGYDQQNFCIPAARSTGSQQVVQGQAGPMQGHPMSAQQVFAVPVLHSGPSQAPAARGQFVSNYSAGMMGEPQVQMGQLQQFQMPSSHMMPGQGQQAYFEGWTPAQQLPDLPAGGFGLFLS